MVNPQEIVLLLRTSVNVFLCIINPIFMWILYVFLYDSIREKIGEKPGTIHSLIQQSASRW